MVALRLLCVGLVVTATSGTNVASKTDLARARTKEQSGAVGGKSAEEIAQKINRHLEKQAGTTLRACSDFTHEQLNGIVRQMWPVFSTELQQIYKEKSSDGRLRGHQSLEEFEARWLSEADSLKDAAASEVLREAKCAEVLMLWAHHVSDSDKQLLREMPLPLLPTFKADVAHSQPAVASRYSNSFTCVTGHNMQAGHTSDHKLPHWPEEVHYYGKGHGAYPFWVSGKQPSGNTDLEVWWSEKQLAEKFYHHDCAIKDAGASKDGPCFHLMLGGQPNPQAYLYTAAEDFCCISGPSEGGGGSAGASEKLAPPQSDFMDNMTNEGEMDFKGDFYTGKVIKYIMKLPQTEAVSGFWYLTTPEGLPVQQGEGGSPTANDNPKSDGKGILLWHEYNYTTFKATTIDPSNFVVPSICQKTSTQCTFPMLEKQAPIIV